MMDQMKKSRRELMKAGLAAGIVMALPASGADDADSAATARDVAPDSLSPKPSGTPIGLPRDKMKGIEKIGGTFERKIKGVRLLIIRIDEKNIRAFDANCPHKRCPVLYKKKWGELRCKCHGSTFTMDGAVTKGPAEADLKQLPAILEEERIVIYFPD
jgi:cytochrome b6-f complex iron-sulfur subunit